MLGAGDAFASGMIWGLRRGLPLDRAVRMGNAVGAIVVTRARLRQLHAYGARSRIVRGREGWVVMKTERLTVAQALVKFLGRQKVARDGREHDFFAGVFGIFGHGNVAGIGEALLHRPAVLPFYVPRNEQAMVHTAAAFAKASARLRTLVCTTSIGPGATNMVTGAAAATINRLPVLLLPGDIFATRRPDPVLQQLESPRSRDISVNDCFKPVSRYWDRINRPEQLTSALMEAMRVLTSPADTGAVTLGLPQDVQTEAFDYPAEAFRAARLDHSEKPAGSRCACQRPRERDSRVRSAR